MIEMVNALNDELTLPITMAWDSVDIQRRAEVNELEEGGVIAGKCGYLPRRFSVHGSLFIGDKEDNNEFYDELKEFLQHQPIRIDRGYSRYISAYMEGLSCIGLDDDAELELNIAFVAPDPFFYGEEVVKQFTLNNTLIDNITGDGTAPSDVLIEVIIVSATANSLSIELGGFEVSLEGVLEKNDVVVFDSSNITATLNGISAISSVGDKFLIYGMKLLPKLNSVKMSLNGNATVKVSYKPTWI